MESFCTRRRGVERKRISIVKMLITVSMNVWCSSFAVCLIVTISIFELDGITCNSTGSYKNLDNNIECTTRHRHMLCTPHTCPISFLNIFSEQFKIVIHTRRIPMEKIYIYGSNCVQSTSAAFIPTTIG